MIYRDVETLRLAFDWVREFILSNGITKIPEWWAFIVETCGILSWFVVFIFLIALFVGYSRQMSSFYFLYESMTGKKLSNPYKPAFLFFLIWCSLYIVCGGVTLTGVYFLKYGYLYAIFAALLTIVSLAVVFFAGFKVAVGGDKNSGQNFQNNPMHYQQPQFYPVYPHIAQQTAYNAIPQQAAAQQSQQYLQIGAVQAGANIVPHIDHQFEEALQFLGLERGFTKAQLKKKYHDLAKKFHSDKEKNASGVYLKVKACYEYLLQFAQ